MKFTSLKRNHLRYVMFRLKTGQTHKHARLTGKDMQKLLSGWGHDISVTSARKLLAEIKTHYSHQIYFTGWENFAAEVTHPKTGAVRGTNKSWDIGMIDGGQNDGGDEVGTPVTRIKNTARMVNRPHKWFLFGHNFTEVVPTRGLENSVTAGLDHYERQGLLSSGPTLRDIRLYPDVSGKKREFDYVGIYSGLIVSAINPAKTSSQSGMSDANFD